MGVRHLLRGKRNLVTDGIVVLTMFPVLVRIQNGPHYYTTPGRLRNARVAPGPTNEHRGRVNVLECVYHVLYTRGVLNGLVRGKRALLGRVGRYRITITRVHYLHRPVYRLSVRVNHVTTLPFKLRRVVPGPLGIQQRYAKAHQ